MTSSKPVVIVTGSSGYVGSAIIEKLAKDFTLVGLDRETSPHPPVAAECVCIDITSDRSVQMALERVKVAYGTHVASVVHLAAYFDVTGEPDPRYQSVTVEGTKRLLQALEAFEVEQFIFMSTVLVHAPSGHDARINEDTPLDDRFPYRASKIRAERAILEQHGAVPVVLLRPAGVYDDHGHNTFLAHQVARIYEKRLTAYVYPGDLQAGQPYLHLKDLVDAVSRLIERRADLPAETTLLLAESDVMSFGELQKAIGRLAHNEDWQTRSIPKPLAAAGAWAQDKILEEDPFIRPYMVEMSSDHYEVDSGRARKLLSWRPRHSLRRTLPDIIAALKSDPVAWYTTNRLDAARVAAAGVEAQSAHHNPKAESENGSAGGDGNGDGMTESRGQGAAGQSSHHQGMAEDMRKGHFQMLWVHWLNILLGAWLVASPFAFGSFDGTGFSDAVMRVTADRGLVDPVLRSLWLGRSDIVAGLLVMLFGTLSLSPRLSWAQWANAAVGCWLLFAPLVFWAPSAAAYTNDTFVGALVIAFAILVPMMPGMAMGGMMDKSDLPTGWSYSPSTYLQRLPIIALGAFGFLIARSLTAYQLGHIDGVWEPFFNGIASMPGKNGTESIITSDVSKAWPIADGGLGAVAYVFEVLMGVMGDRRRWRTMPWMVAMFGIVVVPLGVVSIYFVIIQPILIGTWCTLCLVTAVAMLIMIPYSLDELVAMGQFLVQSHRRGEPFWRTFFRGGAQPEGAQQNDAHAGFDAPLPAAVASAVRGVNLPWTLVASAGLGVFLMFTRVFFDTAVPMADSDHVTGALIVTFSVMAMAEVGRSLRFANLLFGVWLVLAPWLLGGASMFASIVGTLLGLAVVVLSLPRGKRSDAHYGDWDRYVI
jgi:nucleoside-diphosphate-sugar epimerase/uncharacterized membrane protein